VNPYVVLLDLGSSFLKQFVGSLTKSNAPAQIIDAVNGVVTAIDAHKDDVINKANLEADRG
jgi:hypothetical protein